VILNDGLEEIGEWAFKGCAFARIEIPLAVRAIIGGAFKECSQLATVILNDGLGEIGRESFNGCAFVRIVIPPAIRAIDAEAFKECSNLTNVQFCDEIEEFMSGGVDAALVE